MAVQPSGDNSSPSLTWSDLVAGTPTIIGLATLCARAIALGPRSIPTLSLEAQAILWSAKERCSIEVKGVKNAYDSSERMLAVHVELAPEKLLAFRSRVDPHYTIRMLGGLVELCGAGLVMHLQSHEFSLSRAGIAAAAQVDPPAVSGLIAQAIELDFED